MDKIKFNINKDIIGVLNRGTAIRLARMCLCLNGDKEDTLEIREVLKDTVKRLVTESSDFEFDIICGNLVLLKAKGNNEALEIICYRDNLISIDAFKAIETFELYTVSSEDFKCFEDIENRVFLQLYSLRDFFEDTQIVVIESSETKHKKSYKFCNKVAFKCALKVLKVDI